MGSVGDYYILTDIPARDKGALVEDSSLDANTLSDYTLTGLVVRKNEITEQLAEAENMTLEDYRNYYHMADVEIHDYDGDQERLRIYQLMLLIGSWGCCSRCDSLVRIQTGNADRVRKFVMAVSRQRRNQ